MINNTVINFSNADGGFKKLFNSVSEVLSRQLTASFAASDFSFLLNRKEKFPVLNVIKVFEGK